MDVLHWVLVFLLLLLILMFVLPTLAYLVVKLATVGFYRGKQAFDQKFEKKENRTDGKRSI